MKHARADYDRIQDPDPNGIPEDEPVFLVRGQDKIAWASVAIWAILAFLAGANRAIVILALKHSVKMLQWDKKKTPDL